MSEHRRLLGTILGIGLAALVGFGCGRKDESAPAAAASPLLRAKTADTQAIDVGRAAREVDELARALATPHHVAAAGLGAHRFRGTHAMKVSQAGRIVDSLDETTTLEVSSSGDLHGVYKNSREYGRELFYANGTVWIRPGFGKYHRRPPSSDGEAARAADEMWSALGADFELVAPSASLSDGGSTQVSGRQVRRVRLSLGEARPRRESSPQRAWRETVLVKALAGEILLDEASGAVVGGQLDAELSYVQKQGGGAKTYEMKLRTTHAVTDVGANVSISPPSDADSVATPGRTQEFEERQQLLEGLAAPARKAPTPADAPPAKR